MRIKGTKGKIVVYLIGKLISIAWSVLVVLLIIAALESRREVPFENGFYYAFVYGLGIWIIMYAISFEPVNRLFNAVTSKLKLPGKILQGTYRIVFYTIMGPAELINKLVKVKGKRGLL